MKRIHMNLEGGSKAESIILGGLGHRKFIGFLKSFPFVVMAARCISLLDFPLISGFSKHISALSQNY